MSGVGDFLRIVFGALFCLFCLIGGKRGKGRGERGGRWMLDVGRWVLDVEDRVDSCIIDMARKKKKEVLVSQSVSQLEQSFGFQVWFLRREEKV